ncbi:hypothetical protein [Piscirickettsia litoralis]|uniref:EamA domain-containing protein n=1 Tax=Piscirickettsia litoralis TaxID=1891921 RepID=A0ABX3A2B2_9GAMM|nr:hypothetical protein [Piscirickettsia litoralis]ODN43002.1 hypothetical protein BGC07_08830 [Piscirickettsia litoralis]
MKAIKLIKESLVQQTAIIYMIISAICIASAGFFAKIAMQYTSVQMTLLARFGVPLVLLVIFFTLYKKWRDLQLTNTKNTLSALYF